VLLHERAQFSGDMRIRQMPAVPAVSMVYPRSILTARAMAGKAAFTSAAEFSKSSEKRIIWRDPVESSQRLMRRNPTFSSRKWSRGPDH
jgi:hypothetical protein